MPIDLQFLFVFALPLLAVLFAVLIMGLVRLIEEVIGWLYG